MDSDVLIAFLVGTGTAGGIIGGVATWITGRLDSRYAASLAQAERNHASQLRLIEQAYASELGLQADIARILFDLRMLRYKEVWELTSVVSWAPRNRTLTYEKLQELSEALRDWYFHQEGGILLSLAALSAYSELQGCLWNPEEGILWSPSTSDLPSPRTGLVTADHYERVRERCAALRTEMSGDIQRRRDLPGLDSAPGLP